MISKKLPNLVGYQRKKSRELKQKRVLRFFRLLDGNNGRFSRLTTFFCYSYYAPTH